MHDTALYAQILGVLPPWQVIAVEVNREAGEVTVRLRRSSVELRCPECGQPSGGYDTKLRRWRHLDTCQYRTILEAEVPRVECSEHGVRQVKVPWAEDRSRFTALFEALVIDWLREASTKAVAQQVGLTWDEADGIMQRAVARGLARREPRLPEAIGVDETSFQKRHQYVTVVTDQVNGTVLHVADNADAAALKSYYEQFETARRAAVQTVAMDMSKAYISATEDCVPDAAGKIAFDKYHVASHLGTAVDKVRRREHKELAQEGDNRLAGTRYDWLTTPQNMSRERWREFRELRESKLRTARAWALKELAMDLWRYRTETWARKAWEGWYGWAIRSRLEPIKKVARMMKTHLQGILNAVVRRVTNARAEGVNSAIQRLKYQARGFRSRERFRTAIYFHCGHLDLYPASLADAEA
jgi:transposase